MNLLDTHFHLDLHKQSSIAELIEKERIYTIAVTNAPSVFHYTYKIALESKFIRAALGLHPQLAEERQKELPLFMELLSQTRYIGEVGIDDRNSSSFSVQKKVFEKIVNACSEAGNKILTIHSRRADKEIVDIVGSQFPGKVVLHWFSGSMQVLERAVDAGYYFSVNHAMATSASGQRLIQQIPVNRLLTESDGPFVEYQGKPCSPLNIPTVISLIAKLKPELVDEPMVANAVYSNFKQLLN